MNLKKQARIVEIITLFPPPFCVFFDKLSINMPQYAAVEHFTWSQKNEAFINSLWHMKIVFKFSDIQNNVYQKKTDPFPSLQNPNHCYKQCSFPTSANKSSTEDPFTCFQNEVVTLTTAAVIPGKIRRSPTFLFILVWTLNFFLVLALHTVSQFTVKRNSLLNLILRHNIKYTCSTSYLQLCL